LDPNLMQRCMMQEYMGAGVVVLDKARYEKFFGPSIDLAYTTYREEREKYLKDLSTMSPKALDEAFDRTPDLEKPFFVQQLGWRLAQESQRKADAAIKKAHEVEIELDRMKLERDSKWRHRKEIRDAQVIAERR